MIPGTGCHPWLNPVKIKCWAEISLAFRFQNLILVVPRVVSVARVIRPILLCRGGSMPPRSPTPLFSLPLNLLVLRFLIPRSRPTCSSQTCCRPTSLLFQNNFLSNSFLVKNGCFSATRYFQALFSAMTVIPFTW